MSTNKLIDYIGEFLLGLDRKTKRITLALIDGVIFSSALWLSLYMRYGSVNFLRFERFDYLYLALPIIGVFTIWMAGLYRVMVRTMESRTIGTIALGSIIVSLFLPLWAFFDAQMILPRSVPFLFALLVFLALSFVRVILRRVFYLINPKSSDIQKVVIYGAGQVGTEIAAMMRASSDYSVVGFVDDDPKVQGAWVNGISVYAPKELPRLNRRFGFDCVVVAMHTVDEEKRRKIVAELTELEIPIKVSSGIGSVFGENALDSIQPIRIEDLLGRRPVAPLADLIDNNLMDKTILITGAAGSIGSELLNQIMNGKPKCVIALDSSEYGMYELQGKISKLNEINGVDVQFKLGSVLDRKFVARAFADASIDIVYHAAAYKHVPIVEENVLVGVENNAFGTKIVAEEAVKAGVERFVLISTDKAVRPTNVMGASKRLAELIIQGLQDEHSSTILSMVRFGNVLGSSGSVIPLFTKQIEQGGPITLTHKEVTRYFMTVSEAAQLVIQAGFMANGGEVFVLDMGEPAKLHDLAKLMIRLSGKKEKYSDDDTNGIEIREIGLRPGEKLYEELLIGGNVAGTGHSKIMMATEERPSAQELQKFVKSVDRHIAKGDAEAVISILRQCASLSKENDSKNVNVPLQNVEVEVSDSLH